MTHSKRIRLTAIAATAGFSIISLFTALPAAAQVDPTPTDKFTLESSKGTSVDVDDVTKSDATGSSSYSGTGTLSPSTNSQTDAEGDFGTDSIIGTDDRTRVDPTTTFPHRAVVAMEFTNAAGNGSACTGWMVDADLLVTAGHCVHNGSDEWNDVGSYEIAPARNDGVDPYGTCGANTLYAFNGWTNNGDEEYDFGLIDLDCTVGNQTGWFGYWWQSASLDGESTTVTGYPGFARLQMTHANQTVEESTTNQVFYRNDTEGGQSGSPVYRNHSEYGWAAFAVHTNGVASGADGPHGEYNHGRRITEAAFDAIQSLKL
ncbi:trypsin-like serine peptidase [Haloglycomyces albus]|uniref:trypsin-like serine peptidase n=1 Tax=Haloglycomyces albus TaxID=526067 RepID=UPI00046CC7A8|nr:trypsin-like serine protease [Haloglycomyces albus]